MPDAPGFDDGPIRQRLAAATPGGYGWGGPWGCDLIGDTWSVVAQSWDLATMAERPPEMSGSEEQRRADAEFIAHAPDDIAALLAELDRLRAERDAVLALHKREAHAYGLNSRGIDPRSTWYSCDLCGCAWPCPTARAAGATPP